MTPELELDVRHHGCRNGNVGEPFTHISRTFYTLYLVQWSCVWWFVTDVGLSSNSEPGSFPGRDAGYCRASGGGANWRQQDYQGTPNWSWHWECFYHSCHLNCVRCDWLQPQQTGSHTVKRLICRVCGHSQRAEFRRDKMQDVNEGGLSAYTTCNAVDSIVSSDDWREYRQNCWVFCTRYTGY